MTKREKLISYLEHQLSTPNHAAHAALERDLEVAKAGEYDFVTCPTAYQEATGIADIYQLGHNMNGCECVGICSHCWRSVLKE